MCSRMDSSAGVLQSEGEALEAQGEAHGALGNVMGDAQGEAHGVLGNAMGEAQGEAFNRVVASADAPNVIGSVAAADITQ